MNQKVRDDFSRITEHDVYLFKEGAHFRLADKLGSHLITVDGRPGVQFAVWAPNARQVSVMGDFNRWSTESHALRSRHDGSGIWEGFIPGLAHGTCYKYRIRRLKESIQPMI
jgi:1,4-alpha-glucan branching enzyme